MHPGCPATLSTRHIGAAASSKRPLFVDGRVRVPTLPVKAMFLAYSTVIVIGCAVCIAIGLVNQ